MSFLWSKTQWLPISFSSEPNSLQWPPEPVCFGLLVLSWLSYCSPADSLCFTNIGLLAVYRMWTHQIRPCLCTCCFLYLKCSFQIDIGKISSYPSSLCSAISSMMLTLTTVFKIVLAPHLRTPNFSNPALFFYNT